MYNVQTILYHFIMTQPWYLLIRNSHFTLANLAVYLLVDIANSSFEERCVVISVMFHQDLLGEYK